MKTHQKVTQHYRLYTYTRQAARWNESVYENAVYLQIVSIGCTNTAPVVAGCIQVGQNIIVVAVA
jgi:hypothetical protein